MDAERFLEEASAFERAQDGFCIVEILGINELRIPFELKFENRHRISVSYRADREAIFQAIQLVSDGELGAHRPTPGGPGFVPKRLGSHEMWGEILHDFGGYLHLLEDFHPGLKVISLATDQQVAFVRMADDNVARDFEMALTSGDCPFGVPLDLASEFLSSSADGH